MSPATETKGRALAASVTTRFPIGAGGIGCYAVPASDGGEYIVTVDVQTDSAACTCLAGQHGIDCSHVVAALLVALAEVRS